MNGQRNRFHRGVFEQFKGREITDDHPRHDKADGKAGKPPDDADEHPFQQHQIAQLTARGADDAPQLPFLFPLPHDDGKRTLNQDRAESGSKEGSDQQNRENRRLMGIGNRHSGLKPRGAQKSPVLVQPLFAVDAILKFHQDFSG